MNRHKLVPPIFNGLAILVACLLLAGCQQQITSKLSGKWVGSPDTPESRTKRETEKYGDSGTFEEEQANGGGPKKTDWEDFNVAVEWDFLSRSDVEMTLDGVGQKVSGNWKIIGTSPTGCTIEVVTNSDQSSGDAKPVRRRFEIEFDEREGELVGFLLHESGADRQLGILYFQRPK